MITRFLRAVALIFLFACFSQNLAGQMTIISGKVYDSLTQEPMPFVNILLLGTKVGAVSDIDGNFTITTSEHADTIRAQYIGYKPTFLPIKNGVKQTINIPMSTNTILNVVTIYPGENPAVTILKKVWAHKPENNKEKLDCYQYESYNKLEFDLNNISEEFQKSKIMRPVKFIFDQIDSTNPTEKPHLPMFFSETVSDFYYRKDPKTKKEIIKGSQVSGVEDASISQFTGEMYQDVNIYDNNIILFGKHFVSPISNQGTFFYKYYLIDSISIDGHWCYQIQFIPKRKQELLFDGNMWIADTAFAVKRLEMTITEDANLNYCKAFYVIQDYDNTSGAWMLTQERVVADFQTLSKKQVGLYGRKTTSYRNIIINKPKEDDFYTRTDNLIVEPGAEKRDSAFWAAARHDTLSRREQGIYDMVDSVQNLPIYKTWEDVVIIAYSGYKIVGPMEYGPWYKTVSKNQIEGWRFRVGGRTSNAFSRWVEASGYVAYGLKDQEFKYNFGFKSFITKKPRQLIGINYKNDYEILGNSNNAFTSDNALASLFRTSPLTNMTRVEQYELWYERDWWTGFNMRLAVVNRNMYPLDDTSYYRYDISSGERQFKPGIHTAEVRANFRFAWDEKYIEGVFSRVSMGTRYPVIQVQYVAGLKGVLNSDYSYHRLSINLDDRIRINPIGYTNYILEAGKIWGVLPYPLMVLHAGNETYVYDWASFNTMNYYEFASDQYAMATVIHHFDGFFLNHVPLMRKLKWREVVSFRCLFGSVNQANKDVLTFPSTLFTLNKGPFMEVGAGIENIFRFFRVDYFWRLTYRDNPDLNPIGLRVSVQVLF